MRYALDAPDPEGINEEPATASAAGEAPGDRIGRYRLGERIGEGGCGVVYAAEQEEPVRRTVALKVIKLGMDTEQVIARFAGERQALALMDHPNIAKVLDAGATDTGRPYFVMELVRGISITSFCDRHALSTRRRLDLFIKVCHAVQHAHQKGIIHRDLKASNILVQEGDADEPGVPKVIDFGIAKATGGRLSDLTLHTAFRQFLGTPGYMSPEQVDDSHDIDTRTDIYSLGVLLYELLAGKPPFDTKELLAAGLDEMRRTIREKEPVKPSTRLTQELSAVAASRKSAADSPGQAGGALPRRRYEQLQALIRLLRGDLDWVVMKCLEKHRGRRYATANDLALDLQHHLNNEPVAARPPSPAYRFQKLVRRNKAAFAAGTAVVAALVVGLGLSTWFYLRESQAHGQAVAATLDAKQTLSAADLSRAVGLIAEGSGSEALACLARGLSADPSNAAALTRLTTLSCIPMGMACSAPCSARTGGESSPPPTTARRASGTRLPATRLLSPCSMAAGSSAPGSARMVSAL
jgi:serine/threonine protein kinase